MTNVLLGSKCDDLSPVEADKLFFPGPGGKVNKARKFCDSCPIVGICLQNAIDYELEGFWAGTTEDERRSMKKTVGSFTVHLDDFLPPKPNRTIVKKPRLLKTEYDPYGYLDKIEPREFELKILELT